ncbi:hypothetical protein DICVIV_01390 [Dictyocaulus viviparus]|uniref:Uncharacterized protein n=1 Tax=Dictyocaulus viviparus TaxID=29172 RepID=A0A0D8Y6D1_DICVI|nr:hypothetical protein DICVIV_01390 [Dictyocaulus viviparus]
MTMTIIRLIVQFSITNLIIIASSPQWWTRRHLGNGKLYEFNGTDSESNNIGCVEIHVNVEQTRNEFLHEIVHAIRISWSPVKNASAYRVQCEANTTDDVITIVDKEINDVTKVDGHFVLPPGPLSVICRVASANKHGSPAWTYSPMVTTSKLEATSSKSVVCDDPVTHEELTNDQLLKLIHASEKEDLPDEPIQRPIEERIVIRPNRNTSRSIQSHPYESHITDIGNEYFERHYKNIEKDTEQPIGTNKTSALEHSRFYEVFSYLNRVL